MKLHHFYSHDVTIDIDIRRFCNEGFSLIELLVSLAVVAILAMLAVPFMQITNQRLHEQDLRHALKEIRKGIDSYKRASDEGRVSKAIGASGYPPSLGVLVEGVVDERDPSSRKIYFLRRIPRDPFQTENAISVVGAWGKRSYASDSTAPEEGDDVYDVYSTSRSTGLNGVPYKQW